MCVLLCVVCCCIDAIMGFFFSWSVPLGCREGFITRVRAEYSTIVRAVIMVDSRSMACSFV